MLGGLGHTVIGRMTLNGTFENWERTISEKVLPRAKGMAFKNPDKLLILLDRESRERCVPELARSASEIIADGFRNSHLNCNYCVILADRHFECMLFADYSLVDQLTILASPVSVLLGNSTDGKNALAAIKKVLLPNAGYDKRRHGLALARGMNLADDVVLSRNRALRKFVTEFPSAVAMSMVPE